jgi:hypothetical protein
VVTCGITFMFGGLRISDKAEVLDLTDRPIPGIYAAGELEGGIFFRDAPGRPSKTDEVPRNTLAASTFPARPRAGANLTRAPPAGRTALCPLDASARQSRRALAVGPRWGASQLKRRKLGQWPDAQVRTDQRQEQAEEANVIDRCTTVVLTVPIIARRTDIDRLGARRTSTSAHARKTDPSTAAPAASRPTKRARPSRFRLILPGLVMTIGLGASPGRAEWTATELNTFGNTCIRTCEEDSTKPASAGYCRAYCVCLVAEAQRIYDTYKAMTDEATSGDPTDRRQRFLALSPICRQRASDSVR